MGNDNDNVPRNLVLVCLGLREEQTGKGWGRKESVASSVITGQALSSPTPGTELGGGCWGVHFDFLSHKGCLLLLVGSLLSTIPSDTWICLHFCLHGRGCWAASCFRGTCGLWMQLFTLMWQKGGTRPELACCAVYCLIYLWPCLSHRCQYVLSSFPMAQNVSPGLTRVLDQTGRFHRELFLSLLLWFFF